MTYKSAAMLALGITIALNLFLFINVFFRSSGPVGRGYTPIMDHPVQRMIFSFVSNFILLFILFILNFGVLKSELKKWEKISILTVASLLLCCIISYFSLRLQIAFFDPPERRMPAPFWGGLFRDSFLALVVILISQIIHLNQRRQQIALQYEALKAENIKTKYEALKNQVDPHFLFNTLSTLDSLVGSDPVKAREYIQKFSSVFRYTLRNRDSTLLEDEIAFTQDYASLMQIRYSDALVIRINVQERFLHYEIIPLGIQTLVENAIKHNIISAYQPLVIEIESLDNNMIRVSNNYQPKEIAESGAGVGLANLSERYELMWDRDIVIENRDGLFSVFLPLIGSES